MGWFADKARRWGQWIAGKTSWVVLSRLRNSFLSRAITALSISSLVLANMPTLIESSGINTGSLTFIFFGSLVFLVGYMLFGLWVPPEFAQAGELHDHVQRMRGVADTDFVQSRVAMSVGLVDRLAEQTRFKPPQALSDRLSRKVTELQGQKEDIPPDQAAALFHADLSLRQHDGPIRRLIAAAAMLAGALLLAMPTILNVFTTIFLRQPG